jgi:hypothetical protein
LRRDNSNGWVLSVATPTEITRFVTFGVSTSGNDTRTVSLDGGFHAPNLERSRKKDPFINPSEALLDSFITPEYIRFYSYLPKTFQVFISFVRKPR